MTLSKSPIKKGDVSSWNLPSFAESTSIDMDIGNVKVPTAGDLEKLQEQALQEASKRGYEDGFSKGIKAAEAQIAQKVKSLQSI
ncbi:MAG: flagellar assembly protein FliH, partial [Cycloclasticus sp.]